MVMCFSVPCDCSYGACAKCDPEVAAAREGRVICDSCGDSVPRESAVTWVPRGSYRSHACCGSCQDDYD